MPFDWRAHDTRSVAGEDPGRAGRQPVDEFDVVELLTLLTDRCVEVLGASTAGIILITAQDGLQLLASSSAAMRVLELFELQSDEGPCMDCCRSGGPVVNADLTEARDRWPRFTAEALDAGFRSVDALPMRLRGNVIGALNLFHVDHGALNAIDVAAAQAFADMATIAILQHRAAEHAQRLNDQLTMALESRVVIEQAKGVLAERSSVEMNDAFALLRTYARHHNLRLADVAGDVVSGALPTAEFGRPTATRRPGSPR